MTGGGVIFDLVAAQSPSYRGRGIARYGTEFVRAMVRSHPELVNAVVLHPELCRPEGLEDLAEWVTAEPDWATASVLHLGSVFELEVPVRTFWPREASANRLFTAVTLYDLIPEIFPGWYLEDPGLRRRWRCCREAVRAADAVLTPSESTKQDTVELLGVPERRVTVIGSGTSPVFRPPKSRQSAFRLARKAVGGLEQGFIVYNGAFAPAKNVDRLVEGYARLAPKLTERHQLVIVCEAPPLTRNHYLVMAKELGLEGRVLIPGFVPEEVLVSLHQSAALGVFPSLYEGYGLPVNESMACGTPNIVADNSSLREILPRQARFHGEDPSAIAEAITRGLTDGAFRQGLVDLARKEPPSWDVVADRAASVFEELMGRSRRSRPGWRRRPHLALVGAPRELALATAPLATFDLFEAPHADDNGLGTDGVREKIRLEGIPHAEVTPGPAPFWAMSRFDALRGGYDAVVAWPDELDGIAIGALEQLAEEWPGRCVVLLGSEFAGRDEAAVPPLSKPGLKVLALAAGASWQDTARAVVAEAQAARGYS